MWVWRGGSQTVGGCGMQSWVATWLVTGRQVEGESCCLTLRGGQFKKCKK